ncbi:hypothetical protein ACN27F_23370 [Solwaraspora sp. WMMB335]|uniref:hypothetical protein n=1 Tax=Solwaraspora sp. WMMB335 TaxID=3404118 RepID=UPI003B940F3C
MLAYQIVTMLANLLHMSMSQLPDLSGWLDPSLVLPAQLPDELDAGPDVPDEVREKVRKIIGYIRFGVLTVIGASALIAVGGIGAGRVTQIAGYSKLGSAALVTCFGASVLYVIAIPLMEELMS